MTRSTTPFMALVESEFSRMVGSRKFKALFAVTLLPSIIYLLSPSPQGKGVDAMLEGVESLLANLIPNYWLGIIGQFIAIIPMSDLIAGEIDRGTIRLLLAKPIRISEIVAGKFLAGLAALMILYGTPIAIILAYAPLPYHAGLDGLEKVAEPLLYAIAAAMLVLVLLGSLTILVSSIIPRPLYAALAAFGLVFLAQYLIPQIPYIENPEDYTLAHLALVLLKPGFTSIELAMVAGDPLREAAASLLIALALLVGSWIILSQRDYSV